MSKCGEEDVLDGWMIADRNQSTGDVLLFRPFSELDIQSTTSEVLSMLQSSHDASRLAEITTYSPEGAAGSGSTSPADETIDEILDATTLVPSRPATAPTSVSPTPLSLRLCTINSFSQSIASNPLIQAEMARLFLKDEGLVQELISQGIDIDELTKACFANASLSSIGPGTSSFSLLPPIAQEQRGGAAGEGGAARDKKEGAEGGEDQPIHHHIMEALKGALNATGDACQWLGGWLRDRAAEIFPPPDQQTTMGGAREGGEGREGGGKRILDVSLAVLSIVFVVLILRRPISSFRILRGAFV